jgi:hypothetical protein
MLWISCVLLAVGIALLLRYMYINVEHLPTPSGDIWSGVLEMVKTEDGKTRLFDFAYSKYFWITFVISFVWFAVAWLKPEGMSGYAFTGSTLGVPRGGKIGEFDASLIFNLSLGLYGIAFFFSLVPFELSWAYLLSTETLVGVVLGTIVMAVIYNIIMYPLANLETLTPGSTPSLWSADGSSVSAGIITGKSGFIFGGIIALAIIPIWRNRRIFSSMLKGTDRSDT